MRRIGYARVSTDDQHLELQIDALEKAGCSRIYQDHGVSGSLDSRPALDRMLRTLKNGDELIVWRLDRLGRSLVHLVQMLEGLGRRGVHFRSLCEHIDTGSAGGRLVFHMMAALAEFERSLISERTRAGIAAARVRGARIGRPPVFSDELRTVTTLLVQQGSSPRRVAARFGVSERTVRRWRDSAVPTGAHK